MNKLIQRGLASVALCLAAWGAQAHLAPPEAGTATPGIDAQQARQHARIAQGAAHGSLTRHEQHRLQHQQGRIAHARAHAQADGVVTRQERHHLRHLQHHASRSIYRQKHDREVHHAH